jgi:hypothetical protein
MRISLPELLASLLLATPVVSGQTVGSTAPQTKPPATITGSVTVDGKPASGIDVVMRSYDYNHSPTEPYGVPVSRALTDKGGRYMLTFVTPGQYAVAASGAGLMPDSMKQTATWFNPPFRIINIAEGESVTGFDLGLIRTGSISGHVKAADGQPLIGRWINLILVENGGRETPFAGLPGSRVVPVDAQGAYKLSLPPGRYKIGVKGQLGGTDGKLYRDVYYPGVEPAQAAIIDVKAGSEVSNIDFDSGPPFELVEVSGVGIADDSGTPVPGITYHLVQILNQGRNHDCRDIKSDSNGVFRSALLPGQYLVCGAPGIDQDRYSDPISFDVNLAGVDPLTITLHHSMTVNGSLVGAGSNQRKLPIGPDQVPLRAFSFPPDLGCGSEDQVSVTANGSFTITGVVPGTLSIQLDQRTAPKGLALLRMEPSSDASGHFLNIFQSDQSVNVRAIISYARGTLRGRIIVDGWQLPRDTQVQLIARPLSKDAALAISLADARGEFVIDELADGDFDITLTCSGAASAACWKVGERITIAGGKAPYLTLVLPNPSVNK